jgi:hypothetical protein
MGTTDPHPLFFLLKQAQRKSDGKSETIRYFPLKMTEAQKLFF